MSVDKMPQTLWILSSFCKRPAVGILATPRLVVVCFAFRRQCRRMLQPIPTRPDLLSVVLLGTQALEFRVPMHLCPAAGKFELSSVVTALYCETHGTVDASGGHIDFTTRYVIWQTKQDMATFRPLPFQQLQLLHTAFTGLYHILFVYYLVF